MKELKSIYDERYSKGYRSEISGYEYARSIAVQNVINNKLNVSQIKNVLDYGCGSGLHVDLWKNLFPISNLYCCDISSVALKKLTKNYPELSEHTRLIDNNKAPFKDELFDLILSIEVMEHVENLNLYINDINRLLKYGGYFIWTTPCGNPFSIEHIFNLMTNQIEKTNEGYRRWKWEDPTHIRRLKSNEIKSLLIKNGYDKVSIRYRSHFFSFICSRLFKNRLQKFGERLMLLDYYLFRILPNGASMIGLAIKK